MNCVTWHDKIIADDPSYSHRAPGAYLKGHGTRRTRDSLYSKDSHKGEVATFQIIKQWLEVSRFWAHY